MGFNYDGKSNDVNGSVGLLISILVCYPEVAAINFDPEKQLIRFTFIYSKVLIENELDNLKARLLNSIEVYNQLEGRKNSIISLNSQICDNLTIIEVQRDVNTLFQEEITLIVELFRQCFNNNLVTEGYDQYIEEEIVAQEEMIGHMLERIKGTSQDKYLFAFREEGRVLVFDK
ncbi:hypothetical protein L9W92_08905 [Pelotomaculum terephthalicicum JT]|nr:MULTISPECIES: hypothetical protein [Pelotomaculum]MCG9968168.1 hypothetical protein [Pelotomaculum terephthalicicum JT]OPX83936.1 MAG: hypothetical protein A4E54_02901 [Pelotomaculum sp. PtaB.Bin117]